MCVLPLTVYLKMYKGEKEKAERESKTTTRHRNKIKCNFYYAQWFLLPALSFYKFFAHCPCLVLSCLIFVYGMSSRCHMPQWPHTNTHTQRPRHTRLGHGALAFCYIFAFYGFFIDSIIMLLPLVFDQKKIKGTQAGEKFLGEIKK